MKPVISALLTLTVVLLVAAAYITARVLQCARVGKTPELLP